VVFLLVHYSLIVTPNSKDCPITVPLSLLTAVTYNIVCLMNGWYYDWCNWRCGVITYSSYWHYFMPARCNTLDCGFIEI